MLCARVVRVRLVYLYVRLVYIFGQVFVCTAGMLAVPIRMQYVSFNQHRQNLNIACSKCTLVVFKTIEAARAWQ